MRWVARLWIDPHFRTCLFVLIADPGEIFICLFNSFTEINIIHWSCNSILSLQVDVFVFLNSFKCSTVNNLSLCIENLATELIMTRILCDTVMVRAERISVSHFSCAERKGTWMGTRLSVFLWLNSAT